MHHLLAAALVTWSPPVDAPVTRAFVEGAGAFEAGGHGGVDYEVAPGASVRAAGDGVVAFTGSVAGATFVVVDHGDAVRTAYGQLASVAVRRGATVARGDPLGTAGGAGMAGHPPGVLHFGLRVDGRPVDPLLLFADDLTRLVRLVPADDLPPQVGTPLEERRKAALWFSPRDGPPVWASLPLVADLGAGAAGVLASVGLGLADWVGQHPCSRDAPVEPRPGHLVVVAGLRSRTRRDGSTNDLRPAELGYGGGQVTWFSYSADGGPYGPEDTMVGVDVAAARLAAQLRGLARARPGVPVDLVGHSQGGVVVEAFLKGHYAGHEADYPPLGRVVTLAAPHRGAPLAALAPAPPVRELAEGSPALRRLVGAPLPPAPPVTTLGATGDVFVPAGQTALPGARHVVVDPAGFSDHSGVLTDPASLAAVRLALAGRPPPCRTLPEAVRDRVVPEVIESVERLLVP